MMMLLMIVFLLISVAYMSLLEYQNAQKKQLVKDYKETQTRLYDKLKEEFKEDFKKWDFELLPDLSIKFTNPEVLFASGKAEITDKFKVILKEFTPRYLEIILDDKFVNNIAEVRIEGHTDETPLGYSSDNFVDNMSLSQQRALSVLAYIRSTDYYKTLNEKNQKILRFLLSANGLSFGRTLDSDKKLTFLTNKDVNNENSRRVEFRIVTNSEKLVRDIMNSYNE
jgi:outer membrane protein OmpA-like peptidoglycan-associated protein